MTVSAAVLVTAATAILALCGVGLLCRRVFRDPLDCVAAVLVVAAVAAFGVFALGDLATVLPTSALNALLVGNPIVAVASAAHVDIFHRPLLYELSPIAHRDFRYPAWPLAAALYGGVAVATFLAARARQRAGGLNPPTL